MTLPYFLPVFLHRFAKRQLTIPMGNGIMYAEIFGFPTI